MSKGAAVFVLFCRQRRGGDSPRRVSRLSFKSHSTRLAPLGLLMAFGQHYHHRMSLIDEARRMAPSLSRGVSILYILRLKSGALYVGCSSDAEVRFQNHSSGVACRTTALDPPVSVNFIEIHE